MHQAFVSQWCHELRRAQQIAVFRSSQPRRGYLESSFVLPCRRQPAAMEKELAALGIGEVSSV